MVKDPTYNEAETLRRLVRGDSKAYEQVYNRYWRDCYTVAMAVLKSTEKAEDVVQEIFASLWLKRSQFAEVRALRIYLVTMTRNLTFRALAKAMSEQKVQAEFMAGINLTGNTTDHLVLEGQYRELLNEAIESLPPQQQRVFRLAKTEGLTYEAIAERLGISHATVKGYMREALDSLRKSLAPHISIFAVMIVRLLNGDL